MLSLHKLEIFSITAQEGSFSRAAERLYLTQSAISQHIGDLEKSLGTALFTRGRRGVTLTPAGAILLDYTRSILSLVIEAENAVTNVGNLTEGQVNVGATPGVNVYMLPRWIQNFRAAFQNLTISLQTDVTAQIVSNVLANRLDLGFIEGEVDRIEDERLGVHILQEINMLVIIGQGNRLWNYDVVPLSALRDQPFIMRQQTSQTRIWLEEVLRQNDIAPKVVAEFDNPEAIKAAVTSGMGITLLPDYAIKHEQNAGLVRALPLEGVALRRTLKLIWDKATPFKPVPRAFLTTLAGEYPAVREIAST